MSQFRKVSDIRQRLALRDLSATQSLELDEGNFMRSTKSRSRGTKNRSNNRPTGGSIINRVFDSSGPDGKVRGTPQQIIEKYNQLHRDGVMSGDRVDAENFAQHAEHYTRLLAEAQREVDSKREEQEAQNRERQAERDRERQDRQKAQEAVANDPSAAEQPEILDTAPVETRSVDIKQTDKAEIETESITSGLVETPEAPIIEKPKPPRKPRQRKPRPPVDTAPEAAE